MKLKNVRLSFPNIFRPSQFDANATPKYSAMLIVPKNHPQYKDLNAKIKSVLTAKWGDDALKDKALLKKIKICVRDGSEKDGAGFGEDVVFFNSTNANRPTVVDRDRTPLTESDGRPYAGCYVDVVVDFWAQDNQYGKRINASLAGIQFRADGEAFGGGQPAPADAFDDLSDDESGVAVEDDDEDDEDDFLGNAA